MGEGNSRMVLRFAVLAVAAGFLVGLAVKPSPTTQRGSDKQADQNGSRVRVPAGLRCLHGESSTMVEVRHGKTVVVQPATLTGCKP